MHRHALLPFAVAAFAAMAACQADEPVVAGGLEALAARVDAAHRPGGPTPIVTALRGAVELHFVARAAEQRGQVDLDLRYLEWTRPGGTKVVPLIRYEVKEAGAPIVRGRDRNGPWLLSKGEARDLAGADFAQDLAEFERRQNLVRQLLRFLEAGTVLRSLQQPGPLAAENLTLNAARGLSTACVSVQGSLPAFPLLRRGGDDAPTQIKVYVERATNRLLAVEATPLVDGKPDVAAGERVLLRDLRERDGLLVPHEVLHLFAEADGRFALQSRAVVTRLELRPELKAEDFDRRAQ
jgi:hypothetical protein